MSCLKSPREVEHIHPFTKYKSILNNSTNIYIYFFNFYNNQLDPHSLVCASIFLNIYIYMMKIKCKKYINSMAVAYRGPMPPFAN